MCRPPAASHLNLSRNLRNHYRQMCFCQIRHPTWASRRTICCRPADGIASDHKHSCNNILRAQTAAQPDRAATVPRHLVQPYFKYHRKHRRPPGVPNSTFPISIQLERHRVRAMASHWKRFRSRRPIKRRPCVRYLRESSPAICRTRIAAMTVTKRCLYLARPAPALIQIEHQFAWIRWRSVTRAIGPGRIVCH